MSSKPRLESIIGDLRAVKELVPGTLRETYQLMDERRTCPDADERKMLRNNAHYGGDGNFWYSEESKLWLAVTDTKHNLILEHLDDEVDSSFSQLTDDSQQNYFADPKEFKKVLRVKSTTVIDYSQLRLKKHNDEASYLEISTDDEGYSRLNTEEQKFASRKGYTPENLKMLKEAGIKETRIWLLTSKYAQRFTKEGKIVGLASWLNVLDCNSVAGAVGHYVINLNRLRGVRSSSCEPSVERPKGDVLKIVPYAVAFQRVISSPQELDDTKAAELSNLVTLYLRRK